jgi:hypothetical protein
MTEVTVATRKTLTVAEQIAKFLDLSATYLSKAKALEAKVAAESAFTNVGAGDTVTFTLGRAETKRSLTGSVIARGEVDGKDVVKVIAGEGLATAVYQIAVSAIDSVGVPAVVEAVDQDAADQAAVDDLLAGLSPETEAALNAVQLG